MKRLIPHPALTAGLVLVWLLLTRFSLGNALLGLVIALVAGWALSAIEPEGPRLRRLWPLLRLGSIVGADILRSNIAVAWLILRGGPRHSGFVEVPLRLTDPAQLALLSIIITATPGTAWLEHDAQTGILLLHVFDLRPAADWPGLIRDRYEALLMEAFA